MSGGLGWSGGLARDDAAVSVGGRNRDALRHCYADFIFRADDAVKVKRGEDFAAASAHHGGVVYKEGAVAANAGGVAGQRGGGQVEPEELGQHLKGESCVGGTAAEACPDRGQLLQENLDGRQLKVFCQKEIRLCGKILERVPVYALFAGDGYHKFAVG